MPWLPGADSAGTPEKCSLLPSPKMWALTRAYFLTWVLEIESRSSCSHAQHFTNCTVSPTPRYVSEDVMGGVFLISNS